MIWMTLHGLCASLPVLRYEKIFGEGYVSTGGHVTTNEFVEGLGLKPGEKVCVCV